MKVYLDEEYKCHVADGGGMREVETDFFDGKTDYFVESYRFVPAGERWIDPLGRIFFGEMITAWRSYAVAAAAQTAYEQAKDEDAELFSIIEGSVDINDEE